jgi:hypothetical protein
VAVHQFSALSDGQAISFDPNADVLYFDQTAIAAADVRAVAEGSNLRITAFGKDVVLLNVTAFQLATANSLNRRTGNDTLIGNGGDDSKSPAMQHPLRIQEST